MSTVARQRACAGASGRALFGSRDTQLLHFPLQGRLLHLQAGGTSLGLATQPVSRSAPRIGSRCLEQGRARAEQAAVQVVASLTPGSTSWAEPPDSNTRMKTAKKSGTPSRSCWT